MENEDAGTQRALHASLSDKLPLMPLEASDGDARSPDIITQTNNLILRHGYTKINVACGSGHPDFAYTIGMSYMTNGMVPDIIVYGLPGEIAFSLLDTLIVALKRAMTAVKTPGLLQINIGDLLGNNLMCCLMPVTPAEFGQRALLTRKLFPDHHQQHGFYMQLVWPDARGEFIVSSATQPRLYKQSMRPVRKRDMHSSDVSVNGLWLSMVLDRLPDTGQTFL